MVEALYNGIRKKVTTLSGTAKEKYIWWIAARWSSHRFHAFSFPRTSFTDFHFFTCIAMEHSSVQARVARKGVHSVVRHLLQGPALRKKPGSRYLNAEP